MVSLMVILFSTKCFLFVYMYIFLLKLKAYKLFEDSDADLSRVYFLKKPNCFTSTEKRILTTYINLSRFCFLGTTPVLAPNVGKLKSQS